MSRIEAWLDEQFERYLDILVLAAILLVSVVHMRDAAMYSLNADEALHYNLAHQRSVYQAWLANNTNAHPPLLIVGLYFWRKIGTSELWLRLMPILCNAVMVWFGYRWMRTVAGSAASAPFAVLLLLLPPLYGLAAEIRQYMPMFAGIAVALWAFDTAIASQSRRRMAVCGAGLMVAALSNYSALWFCAAFGCYGLMRIWQKRPPVPVAAAWAAGQLVVAAAYGILYRTHLSKLTGAALSSDVKSGYLREYYIAPHEDIVDFLFRSVPSLYAWAFASAWPATIGFLLASAGVIVVLRRKDTALALLMTVPFLCVLTAVTMELYPFGGTRQSSLFVFIIAAAGAIGLSGLCANRPVRTALISVPALLLLHATAEPEHFGLPLSMRHREFIVSAVDYLRSTVPPGGTVFTDYQASLMLCYYYDPSQYCIDEGDGRVRVHRLERMRILTANVWSFDRESFMEGWKTARDAYQLTGQPVWLFDAGWGQPVHEALAGFADDLREFPGNNVVFRISPGIR